MKTRNLYFHPIEERYVLRRFRKTPKDPNIYIDKNGVVKNVPTHTKYIAENGSITDLTHACDFLCHEGTEIRTALDGVVFDLCNNIKKNYDRLNPPKKEVLAEDEQDGNYVVLKHKNNEYSIYSHLRYKGILVKKGQNVKTGQIIGYSGNTGWSIEPHLHFAVFKFKNSKSKRDLISLKIKWK